MQSYIHPVYYNTCVNELSSIIVFEKSIVRNACKILKNLHRTSEAPLFPDESKKMLSSHSGGKKSFLI